MYDTNAKSTDRITIRRFERVGSGVSSVCWLDKQPGNFIAGDSRSGLLKFFNISQEYGPLQQKTCRI